jgi:two-component system, OmpR family, response regulator
VNRQHPRVLVVEDDPTICHVLAKAFELWYWEAAKALNVTQAIRWLDEKRFDLVIIDMMLPDGSGVDVLRKIRADGLGPKIVIVTARDIGIVAEVSEFKPDEVLFKPFVWEPLRDMAVNIYNAFVPAKGMPE